MTPADLRNARATLGQMWGLNRPLRMAEMGRVLRLHGRDPGASVRDWERGHTSISGPVSLAVEAMLAGWRPSPPDAGKACMAYHDATARNVSPGREGQAMLENWGSGNRSVKIL